MVDDIPMGNAPLINTLFSLSPIETIFSWARQMFGFIKQNLNEQTIQITEFKKKTTDKTELKHATQMADFRTILLR